MKVELPEFKRCCCCLPLRYGLLGAGYIKLAFTLLVLIFVLYTLIIYTMIQVGFGVRPFMPHLIMTAVTAILLILDICMTIVFLVGGHKKKVKLLHIFYIYSIVALSVVSFLFAVSTGFDLYYLRRYSNNDAMGNISFSFMAHSDMLTIITYLGVGVYIILLVRSEIKKLRNNCKFRFVNVANEALCAMENGMNEHDGEKDDLNNETDDDKNKMNNVHGNVIFDKKNGTNDQIEDVIDETKERDRKTFNYTKL